jgi:hypothetical protein
MEQRFCTVAQAVVSSQTHVMHIPPEAFSNLNVHRGTMTIDPPGTGVAVGIPVIVPIPGIPMPVRSINMAVVIDSPPEIGLKTPNPAETDGANRSPDPGQSPNPRPAMTTPRFSFPEALPTPPFPVGFVCCPVAVPAVHFVTAQQLYQVAYQRAVEASRPTLYERFSFRSVN